jgi:hypothetical protein
MPLPAHTTHTLLPAPHQPQELCGIWAYIKWECSGCPNRSKAEADREYEASIQELIMLLRRWAVCEGAWGCKRGRLLQVGV